MEEVNWLLKRVARQALDLPHHISLVASLAWKNKAAGNIQASGKFIQAVAEARNNPTKVKEGKKDNMRFTMIEHSPSKWKSS